MKDDIDLFCDHEELFQLIRKLNAVYDLDYQWKLTKAQRIHQDVFGKQIEPGDEYYRLPYPNKYEAVKLSKNSMKRFLYMIFAPNPKWLEKAENVADKKLQKLNEIIDKMRT